MPCPACDAQLVWRQNGAWCDRCHRKVETCCDGAPQAIDARALNVCAGPDPIGRSTGPC